MRSLRGFSAPGAHRRGPRIGFAAMLVLGLSVAAASGGDVSPRGARTNPVGAPTQPVKTGSVPDSRHRLPFGVLEISPTTLVAGVPGQDLTVTVDPTGRAPDRLEVRIYRPAAAGTHGRDIPRSVIGSETLSLDGGSSDLTLSALNPAPGRYRVDVLDRSGDLIERAAVVVYAQDRLPPAASAPGGAQPGDATHRRASRSGRALPNPSLNHDVSSEAGRNAETYAAAEFDNPGRVIGASNPPSGVDPEAWISNDFMRPGSTVRNVLPAASLRSTVEGGGTITPDLCCDPALAGDDRGNLWYAVVSTSPNYVVINRAAGPSGTSFQSQNVAIPRFSTGLQDTEMIAVDSWPTSPKRYRVYATWIENPNQHVVISECDATTASDCDDPDNWTPGASLPAISGGVAATRSYPSVAAAPNGDVYVAWWDQTQDDITINRCKAAENCRDATQWNEISDVDDDLDPGAATSLPFFCPIISAPGGRVGPQTYVDVGPDGRVYVAYSELRNNGTTRCTASATDRTFESRIAAGAPNGFPALNSGVRLSDDAALAFNDHFFPSLAADPSVAGQVESSLYSTKLDPSGATTQQFYVISTNGGASYSAMQQITTAASDFSGGLSDGFDYGDYEGADSTGGMFYPAWTDNRVGNSELFMLTLEAVAPPPPPPSDGGGGGDTAPPDTQITKRPKDKTKKKTATFEFTATEPSTFQCLLDNKQTFKPCTSPTTVRVKKGKHNFAVFATDAAGNVDGSPATDDWKVKKKKRR